MTGLIDEEDAIFDFKRILAVSEHLKRMSAHKKLAESRRPADRQAVLAGSLAGLWRSLTGEEILQLENRGSRCADWAGILVASDFTTEYIRNCYFGGVCLLGRFDGMVREPEKGVSFPSGLYDSTIVDAVIESHALVYRVCLLANYIIKTGVILFGVASVTATGESAFGNGEDLVIGSETGGREVPAYAEMDQAVATAVVLASSNKKFRQQYREFVQAYSSVCTLACGVVEPGAIIRYCGKISGTYVGEGSLLDKASFVCNSTLLGSVEEPVEISQDAQVSDSCLQWGCTIRSQALVEHAVLLEHAHVERQGKVTHSILGANSGVAEGEVTSCLVGPFTGFHHQALLIAALWPGGKGNIGYGANVGSNHTGKAPDQELLAGEGCFFGLGVNIKYPANFIKAPYSLFATGIDTLPQEITFPFSLINKPVRLYPGVSPSYNEIFPGWMLAHNIYALLRNETKYRNRNRARRQLIPWRIFRPDIIDLMQSASLVLAAIEPVREPERVYTDKEIPGLGKNFMTQESREQALAAYALYSEYYALHALWSCLKEHKGIIERERKSTELLTTGLTETEGECLRRVTLNLGLDERSIEANLNRLLELQESVVRSAEQSKERDGIRSRRILGAYALAQDLSGGDAVLIAIREETRQLKTEIAAWLEK